MLPKGFKLAAKNEIPKEVKEKNKGIYFTTILNSTIYLLLDQSLEKTHQELIFPVVAPDPEKNSDIKYLTYQFMLVVTVVVVKFILPVTRVI
jgi:apocytochrome f